MTLMDLIRRIRDTELGGRDLDRECARYLLPEGTRIGENSFIDAAGKEREVAQYTLTRERRAAVLKKLVVLGLK